jgi:cytochrome o ubiquinol oxidase subunit 2
VSGAQVTVSGGSLTPALLCDAVGAVSSLAQIGVGTDGLVPPTRAFPQNDRNGASGRVAGVKSACTAGAVLLLTGCKQGILAPQGPVARAELLLVQDASVIMLAVIVPVILATLGFAWWFRKGNPRAVRRPDFVYSGRVEMVVWSIPVLTVTFLAGLAWISTHELDPTRPLPGIAEPLGVEVVSLDWKWLFIYPRQGIATVNELVIPAGTPVRFRLTSSGVMNSFFIPQLGSQVYTMSGMATRLHLQADAPGTFKGLSAQFSGNDFSDMRFVVRALPADGFAAWSARTRSARGPLDAAAYTALSRPGTSPVMRYGAVAPGLFETIMAHSAPAGGHAHQDCETPCSAN